MDVRKQKLKWSHRANCYLCNRHAVTLPHISALHCLKSDSETLSREINWTATIVTLRGDRCSVFTCPWGACVLVCYSAHSKLVRQTYPQTLFEIFTYLSLRVFKSNDLFRMFCKPRLDSSIIFISFPLRRPLKTPSDIQYKCCHLVSKVNLASSLQNAM